MAKDDPKNAAPKYAYAIVSCVVGFDGGKVRVKRGQVWDADDPFVKAKPDFFSEDSVIVHRTRPVEDATSEPGRKRAI